MNVGRRGRLGGASRARLGARPVRRRRAGDARHHLTGALTKVLSRGKFSSTGLYSSNGTELAVPAAAGLTLVSNAGPVIRQPAARPVPTSATWTRGS
jgi:hypothetical protein